MAHEGSRSNVGFRKAYESGDQEMYSSSEISAAAATSGVNAAGYMDKTKIVNQLHDEDNQRRIDDRYKHDPTHAATMHGNQPSRGAKIDAEIEHEEAEMLANKKDKTDSLPGKKLDTGKEKRME